LGDTPIPTPAEPQYTDRVGLYQGGGGGCKNLIYHPRQECKMIHSNTPFCPVCLEQMILRIYDRINPLEGTIYRSGSTVDAQVSLGDRLHTRWFVDGKLAQDTSTYQPYPSLSPGEHEIQLVVKEEGAPVKRDECSLIRVQSTHL
jgi:hypothetical protein